MIALVIDTAGSICATSIMRADKNSTEILSVARENIGRGHAEVLPGLVAQCIDEARITRDKINQIIVSIGPGNFTGVRVGLAYARGFALGLNLPCVGVNSLQAMALQGQRLSKIDNQPVSSLLDIKRGEICMQNFDAELNSLDELTSLPISEVTRDMLAPLICGDGVGLLQDNITTECQIVPHWVPVPVELIGEIGLSLNSDVSSDNKQRPKPLYARGPDAKIAENFAVSRMDNEGRA